MLQKANIFLCTKIITDPLILPLTLNPKPDSTYFLEITNKKCLYLFKRTYTLPINLIIKITNYDAFIFQFREHLHLQFQIYNPVLNIKNRKQFFKQHYSLAVKPPIFQTIHSSLYAPEVYFSEEAITNLVYKSVYNEAMSVKQLKSQFVNEDVDRIVDSLVYAGIFYKKNGLCFVNKKMTK